MLKVYHNGTMGREAPGFAFLAARDGAGAVRVYDTAPDAALMEWLDGPTLGDIARGGDDDRAAALLAETAARLHAGPATPIADAPRIDAWLAPFLTCACAPDCPAPAVRALRAAGALGRHLLATARDIRPLHGDLHHDNVIGGPRGFCAIDAKGVIAERTYELANALRNPAGNAALLRDPARTTQRVEVWSRVCALDPQRLRQWAAVKTALSIFWRAQGPIGADPEHDLLALRLAEAAA